MRQGQPGGAAVVEVGQGALLQLRFAGAGGAGRRGDDIRDRKGAGDAGGERVARAGAAGGGGAGAAAAAGGAPGAVRVGGVGLAVKIPSQRDGVPAPHTPPPRTRGAVAGTRDGVPPAESRLGTWA
jgi:hypothetical protein